MCTLITNLLVSDDIRSFPAFLCLLQTEKSCFFAAFLSIIPSLLPLIYLFFSSWLSFVLPNIFLLPFTIGSYAGRAKIEGATLTIHSVTQKDSGEYRCEVTASEDHVNLGEATVTLNVLGMMGNRIKSLESFCHLKSNNTPLTMNVALLTSWSNVVNMIGAANHPTRHLIGYI